MSQSAIVGVDLGGTNVRVGKVLGQRLESHHGQRISAQETQDRVFEEICQAVEQVLDDDVIGIGCGVPSVVDVDQGIVYAVENIPSWHEVHLKERLEQRFSLPVYVNNDANAFALGELYFGEGKGYRNMVGLTLGTGLGAGIIINGHLYSGTNCGAGEIGSIPYKDQTVEFYCAGQFFHHLTGQGGDAVYARAQKGDEQALRLFGAYGTELGHAVMTALYAFDPQIIVLGGSIARAYELFAGSLHRRLTDYDYQHALERTIITRSKTDDVAILGAAALYLDAREDAGL